ncbi:transposase [Streptomyces beijiangensis]|uniref:transposase n=1 Tax=Streptomyces beijiangensis TaxID=163361 RepID=UPI00360CCF00
MARAPAQCTPGAGRTKDLTPGGPTPPLHPLSGAPDPVGALCTPLLGSLPRRDQRHNGELYVKGLLRAPTAQSLRDIASLIDHPAGGQRLHHFINDSPWPWWPVRAALAAHLAAHTRPLAWAVRPATVPGAPIRVSAWTTSSTTSTARRSAGKKPCACG